MKVQNKRTLKTQHNVTRKQIRSNESQEVVVNE